MKLLMRFDDFIAKIIKAIIAIFLFAIMVMLFVGVIARYFFNSPIYWTDELVTYMLVCMTFLGGYLALKMDRLVRVTFVLSILPPRLSRILEIVSQLAIVFFFGVLGYYSINMLSMPVVLNQKTVALGMPMIIFYILIPVMLILMTMRMIINIYNDIKKPIEGGEKEEASK